MEQQREDWPAGGRSHPDGLLTAAEVAGRLNVSESFVYQLVAEGRLRHLRLGKGQGAIRIAEDMLRGFLAGCERGGNPAEQTNARTGA